MRATEFSSRARSGLELMATIVMIAAAGAILVKGFNSGSGGGRPAPPPPPPLPSTPVDLVGRHVKGSPTAELVLAEFGDMECPFCKRFAASTLPELERRYVAGGQVLFAFRHSPLPIHQNAEPAARALECAADQGRFWALHDAMFQTLAPVPNGGLVDLGPAVAAAAVGGPQFETCLAAERPEIAVDLELARQLGVRGTPAFFVGRLEADGRVLVLERLTGAKPLEAFVEVLDRLLRDTD